MKHRKKVHLPGRPVDLLHTDVAETFKRIRREQAAEVKAKTNVVKLAKKAK